MRVTATTKTKHKSKPAKPTNGANGTPTPRQEAAAELRQQVQAVQALPEPGGLSGEGLDGRIAKRKAQSAQTITITLDQFRLLIGCKELDYDPAGLALGVIDHVSHLFEVLADSSEADMVPGDSFRMVALDAQFRADTAAEIIRGWIKAKRTQPQPEASPS
jgi:hypothetical protein